MKCKTCGTPAAGHELKNELCLNCTANELDKVNKTFDKYIKDHQKFLDDIDKKQKEVAEQSEKNKHFDEERKQFHEQLKRAQESHRRAIQQLNTQHRLELARMRAEYEKGKNNPR